jgi:predicted site-specific integrase-resolvase
MKKSSKSPPSATPSRREAVIYARVSSKEQEKEGYSIPAQLKLL